jgi:hypothetical protein
MTARPPNGGRAHQRGAQDVASGPFPLLALGHSSAGTLGRLLVAARGEGSEGERNWLLGFMGVDADFVPSDSAHGHWMKMDGSRHADRPGRPRWENTFLALAHDEAWCVERAARERADVPFFVSGRF